MSRRFACVFLMAACAAALCPNGPLWAARSELIPETMAGQHGLTRPWFAQTQLDQGRGQLRDLVLYEGTLYAQTDKAIVQAIDAETGKTLWWKLVGQPQHPSMTPGVNRDLLAVINGSRLYVLNRYNGDILLEKELTGSPGAGPVLSSKRAYVPLATGLIVAYRLAPLTNPANEANGKKNGGADEKTPAEADRRLSLFLDQKPIPPLFCQSYGHVRVQPLVTRETFKEEYVIWPTDHGYLNLGRIDRQAETNLTLKYRLQTGAAIVGRPAYLPPDPKLSNDSGLIITASRDGFVYVFREKDGESQWRFSVGEPIVESPAVIEDHVYVAAQLGGMFCLAVQTGKEIWFAPELFQFVAASKNRVYATDRIGRLVVLDAQSGARLDVIPTENTPIKLLNTENDRIYVADTGGLIQCLHEIELHEPLVHGKDRKLAAAEAEDKKTVKQKGMGEIEKPVRKEVVAPREHVAPKERPLPKERPKRATGKKKGVADAEGVDAAPNPFGEPAGDDLLGGGNGKTGKAGKTGRQRKTRTPAGGGF